MVKWIPELNIRLGVGASLFVVGCLLSPSVSAQEKTGIATGGKATREAGGQLFPPELTRFEPGPENPIFTGAGKGAWDELIRERGFVLKDRNEYRLYYTGYRKGRGAVMHLGLATSSDGIRWKRHPANPIDHSEWTEDVFVMKHEGTYYLFAEGKHDRAHQMTSTDGIHWKEEGSLDIRHRDGRPIEDGPYGTPTVWLEQGVWHLFYERRDAAVWLATSRDRKVWTLVQDEPVLRPGPGEYDREAIAMNQVFRYQGRYYATYHATAHRPWRDWSTNLAVSDDLVHWRKYSGNPIIGGNRSSGIYLRDGKRWRLYTMHPQVELFYSQEGRTEQGGREPKK